MIEKKVIQKNKHHLLGVEFRIGNKKFTFQGCGPIAIKFTTKISGLDVTKLSVAQLWVRYNNLNPALEEQIIIALKKAGVQV